MSFIDIRLESTAYFFDPPCTADSFAEFFDKKVRDVRSATAGLPPPPISRTASSSLASFRPCTQTEVRRIIIMQSPVKSCMLDPVPTFLVRESVDLLLPFLTTLVNTSLMQGRLPASQKHAIVTRRLNTDRIPLTSPTFGKKYTSQLFRTLCTKSYSNRSILDCVTQEKIGWRFFERRYIDRCV